MNPSRSLAYSISNFFFWNYWLKYEMDVTETRNVKMNSKKCCYEKRTAVRLLSSLCRLLERLLPQLKYNTWHLWWYCKTIGRGSCSKKYYFNPYSYCTRHIVPFLLYSRNNNYILLFCAPLKIFKKSNMHMFSFSVGSAPVGNLLWRKLLESAKKITMNNWTLEIPNTLMLGVSKFKEKQSSFCKG